MATLKDLQDLEAAMNLGVSEVRKHDGSTAKYRSLAEMKQLARSMREELGLPVASIEFSRFTIRKDLD